MSITLTNEQFQALINNVNVVPKKKTKSLIKDYIKAENMEDFVSNMEFLSVKRLMTMSIVDFITETIKKNIDNLEETEYPFVCADLKRKVFYYKTQGNWKKGTDFIIILYNKIIGRAFKDVEKHYTNIVVDDDDDDDDKIEKRFLSSCHCEKQQILLVLCHRDKVSYEKVCDKVLTKIGALLKAEVHND